jgi:hypothetical protein
MIEVNDRTILWSEWARHIDKIATDSKKNLVLSPRWGLIPRLAGRLPVSRNVTFTMNSVFKILNKTIGTRMMGVEVKLHAFSIFTGQGSAYHSELSPRKEPSVRIKEEDG